MSDDEKAKLNLDRKNRKNQEANKRRLKNSVPAISKSIGVADTRCQSCHRLKLWEELNRE